MVPPQTVIYPRTDQISLLDGSCTVRDNCCTDTFRGLRAFLARTETEQPDKGLLECGSARIVEECPGDEAQKKGFTEVGIVGAAALDQLLEHTAWILADLIE